MAAITAAAQTPPPLPSVSSTSSESVQCVSLAKKNANFLPLARTCEYAVSLRSSLPNFVCEQTTESGGYPRNLSPMVVHSRVTYQEGRSQYTDVVVNGSPAYGEKFDVIDFMRRIADFEFGGGLVELFPLPLVTDFKFLREEMLGPVRVAVYRYKVPPRKNKIGAAGDEDDRLRRGYGGQLYVNWETGRPMRAIMRMTGLPKSFQIASAVDETTYRDLDIADLGIFLLPAYSEANVCLRKSWARAYGSGDADPTNCVRCVVWFHDCHKFAAKSRILEIIPPP